MIRLSDTDRTFWKNIWDKYFLRKQPFEIKTDLFYDEAIERLESLHHVEKGLFGISKWRTIVKIDMDQHTFEIIDESLNNGPSSGVVAKVKGHIAEVDGLVRVEGIVFPDEYSFITRIISLFAPVLFLRVIRPDDIIEWGFCILAIIVYYILWVRWRALGNDEMVKKITDALLTADKKKQQ